MEDNGKQIHGLILKIMGKIGHIPKTSENIQQHYKFRGIDDFYAKLNPLFVEHSVVVVPEIVESQWSERKSERGGHLNVCRIRVNFHYVAPDGSSLVAAGVPGEAMDSSDKASNKAMSASMKYAHTIMFQIPTYDPDNDADATSPQAAAPPTATTDKVMPAQTRPAFQPQQTAAPSTTHSRGIVQSSVIVMKGTNPKTGVEWTKYVIIIAGQQYTTFDHADAETAKEAARLGIECSYTYEPNPKGYGLDLKGINPIAREQGTPTPQRMQPPSDPKASEQKVGDEDTITAVITGVEDPRSDGYTVVQTDKGNVGVPPGGEERGLLDTVRSESGTGVSMEMRVKITSKGKELIEIKETPF